MSAWVTFVHGLSGYFRKRRSQIYRTYAADMASLRVCDLGGSRHFWESMPADMLPAHLTLLNIADDGQSRSHTGRFETLDVVIYDGHTIPYPDGHFDVLICNSVVEHVPPPQRERLSREIRRVSKYFFVQTPAYGFPVEPHFVFPGLHWLPRPVGRHFVRFGLWAILNRPTRGKMDSYFDDVHLLTRREVARLFPQATIAKERLLGMVKSYTAHGAGGLLSYERQGDAGWPTRPDLSGSARVA